MDKPAKYREVTGGPCIITGNPYFSTIYWAVLGGLVANLLK